MSYTLTENDKHVVDVILNKNSNKAEILAAVESLGNILHKFSLVYLCQDNGHGDKVHALWRDLGSQIVMIYGQDPGRLTAEVEVLEDSMNAFAAAWAAYVTAKKSQ